VPVPHERAGRFLWVLRWWLWLLPVVRRRRVRFLHCGNLTPTGYLGTWTKRWLGTPYALYLHGMDVEKAIRKLARGGTRARSLRRILDGADRLFANSRDTVARLERAGCDPARIRLLHPGVDVARFRETAPASPRDPDSPVLLSVGRYAKRKGVDRVIRILPTLRERFPGLRLRVAGRRQEESLGPLVRELDVADAVEFVGEVDDARLPELYRSADLFVMPSWEDPATSSVEGFGIVYLEAAACGVPSVGGRTGGVADAIEEGVTGLLAEPGDDEDLRTKIERLLADPEERRAMGAAARARAEREFTWDRAARIVEEEMREVLARRTRG
jgi:phosphatidylinositol alpha-1,6-mannosyltransferase